MEKKRISDKAGSPPGVKSKVVKKTTTDQHIASVEKSRPPPRKPSTAKKAPIKPLVLENLSDDEIDSPQPMKHSAEQKAKKRLEKHTVSNQEESREEHQTTGAVKTKQKLVKQSLKSSGSESKQSEWEQKLKKLHQDLINGDLDKTPKRKERVIRMIKCKFLNISNGRKNSYFLNFSNGQNIQPFVN